MDEEKDYEKWNNLKKKLDAKAKNTMPLVKPREIWWCHIGINIGSEIFGKGDSFTRPILIMKVYPNWTFLAAPLTSTESKHKNQVPSEFKGNEGSVRLDQLRMFDARRLGNRIGQLPISQFKNVMAVLREEF